MTALPPPDPVYAAWARLGFVFRATPAAKTPDIERLLLDTARLAPDHSRLFYGSITWLSQWWAAVARLRLRQLIAEELEPEFHPVIGLLLEEACRLSNGRHDLLEASRSCEPAATPGPLFALDRASPALAEIARLEASPASLKWGCFAPAAERKEDALADAATILKANPSLVDCTVRRGDLRASILVSLRHRPQPSESALARHLRVNRIAVRASLDALETEGVFLRHREKGKRNWGIRVG